MELEEHIKNKGNKDSPPDYVEKKQTKFTKFR